MVKSRIIKINKREKEKIQKLNYEISKELSLFDVGKIGGDVSKKIIKMDDGFKR